MAEELAVGCQVPGLDQPEEEVAIAVPIKNMEEEKKPMIKVGKPAPDFKAPGFHKGKFISTSLSDYKGQWVVLCFYPGDFTFV